MVHAGAAALVEVLLAISVYSGILTSALSAAIKIAAVGTVYIHVRYVGLSTTEKDRLI